MSDIAVTFTTDHPPRASIASGYMKVTPPRDSDDEGALVIWTEGARGDASVVCYFDLEAWDALAAAMRGVAE